MGVPNQDLTGFGCRFGQIVESQVGSPMCVALEEGGLVRRSGSGYLLGRRTVELGGAYLDGFDQIREFYRACEDSEVLRRQLVQIAMAI